MKITSILFLQHRGNQLNSLRVSKKFVPRARGLGIATIVITAPLALAGGASASTELYQSLQTNIKNNNYAGLGTQVTLCELPRQTDPKIDRGCFNTTPNSSTPYGEHELGWPINFNAIHDGIYGVSQISSDGGIRFRYLTNPSNACPEGLVDVGTTTIGRNCDTWTNFYLQ